MLSKLIEVLSVAHPELQAEALKRRGDSDLGADFIARAKDEAKAGLLLVLLRHQ